MLEAGDIETRNPLSQNTIEYRMVSIRVYNGLN